MNYSKENATSETNENQKWEAFFNERETFLKVKLTDEQKESWKRGTLEQAKKALELRKDLQTFYDYNSYSKTLREWLEHWLNPEHENIEYELNNNGCANLIGYLQEELNKFDNHKLERILKNIKSGYYGEWCIDNDENDE